ncbi:hypothetical protein OOT00_05745 [Desulfobotulus sp. H1]|uniref:Uncharacterized protein n=1 Tax=Desulfobotulus pelophilus TaxID=2823377 RepID=A0ABT3N7Q2_9BACT|nr:DUF6678 family protein [Desulfobotulus pelophilus]MCW7753489.1 hypothetical protein [Desulfobotulus pelophilus]
MHNKALLADTGTSEEKENIRATVARRGLCGAANNTKWNELITFMRQQVEWRPSYRFKWINGHISSWDTEWWYHLPFPFMGVEWFDIGLRQERPRGRLIKNEVIDHSPWILKKLREIGFEHEASGDVVRIFGYLPKSLEDFRPSNA